MLEIHNVDIINANELNVIRRKTKKTQILLYDTKRRLDDYISKIKFRRNGKYDDIPHFIVTKTGVIYQIFDTKYYSSTFNNSNIDKKFIKISIENLGWLNKNTITGILNNWINDPYRIEPYFKQWRGYYFWDKYTDIQMEKLSELTHFLCNENNIPFQIVSSQGYVENLMKFQGIVCKSNFTDIYKDINPSFNFKIFNSNAKFEEQLL